ncbi:MAG TPA: N-acetylmuramoyl-L-alanine amidase, partial [Casimicrobiaceae bacterium]|nr:N-acetylmuramoyl-L-alanine amidase [Casimicrobiaceae bacterium]
MVAVHWRGSGDVRDRVRFTDGWSPWRSADDDAVAPQKGWHIGNIDWVGASTALQTRVGAGVTRLRSYTVWSGPERVLARRLQLANAPPIIPRLSWGADESIRRAAPQYAPTLRLAFVHHTVGTNSYTRAQSASIVRGIEIYHVKGNGWNDIGYNFLVDKYGQVFEGRYGGVDRNVIGAHTQGFNTGSFGVAVLGTYGSAKISAAAATSLEQLLSWRLDVAHVDPLSTLTYASGGNPRFPAGTPVFLRAVSGHRDAYFTECPGNALYAEIPAIAKAVASLGGPKIYAPLVARVDEVHTRITARLSAVQPWAVTVTNSAGVQVAQGTGTGTAVDWTWDATAAPPDKYTWTITAADARPATGTLGATTALALQKVVAAPSIVLPGGAVTVAYTLTAAATVTPALLGPTGQVLATFPAVQKPAGAQTLVVTPPATLPLGNYTLVLTAAGAARTVTATAPFAVDDILAAFTVSPVDATVELTRAPVGLTLQILRGTQIVATPPLAVAGGAQTVAWPVLPDGAYTVSLTVIDELGTHVQSMPLVVDTTPPKVTVLSFRRLRFSLNEPATLVLTAGGRR